MRKITKSILTLYPFNYFKFTHYEKENYPIFHDILLFVLLFVLQSRSSWSTTMIYTPMFLSVIILVSCGTAYLWIYHSQIYLTAIPGLILIASAWTDSSILRRIRQVYFGLIAFVMACIFIVDLGLYGFWGFRLDATPFSISSPHPKMLSQASVSGSFYWEY